MVLHAAGVIENLPAFELYTSVNGGRSKYQYQEFDSDRSLQRACRPSTSNTVELFDKVTLARSFDLTGSAWKI